MMLVQLAEVIRGLRRRHSLQDALGHFQHGHVEAELACGRGRFQPDVDDVAQRENPVQRTADRLGQPARAGSGAQQQLVVADGFTVAANQFAPGPVDRVDTGIEVQADALLLVPAAGYLLLPGLGSAKVS